MSTAGRRISVAESWHRDHAANRPAARADLLRRLDRRQEARVAYQQALLLTAQDPERRFLERRLRELEA